MNKIIPTIYCNIHKTSFYREFLATAEKASAHPYGRKYPRFFHCPPCLNCGLDELKRQRLWFRIQDRFLKEQIK